MRIHSVLVIAAALALSLPLSAAHRHGRDCGHIYDSHRGAWISVQLATPFGVGYINRALDGRYNDRYYRDSRSFKQRQRFLKKLRKQRLKEERRFRHNRHHARGARW